MRQIALQSDLTIYFCVVKGRKVKRKKIGKGGNIKKKVKWLRKAK